jgi:hypothetical protein
LAALSDLRWGQIMIVRCVFGAMKRLLRSEWLPQNWLANDSPCCVRASRGSMTTAAERLNLGLIDLAVRGDRPRCSDPVDYLWTSDDQRDRAIAVQWPKAEPAALSGPLALRGDEPVL